jgi:hypothetical protein
MVPPEAKSRIERYQELLYSTLRDKSPVSSISAHLINSLWSFATKCDPPPLTGNIAA